MPTTLTAAVLVNLVGFFLGATLYGLLLAMVVTARRPAAGAHAATPPTAAPRLLLLTGLLGVLWNVGALTSYGLHAPPTGLALPTLVVSFSALGLLPAVVVHSVLDAAGPHTRLARGLIGAAYGLSGIAFILHARAAATSGIVPSPQALNWLTAGFACLMVLLLVGTRGTRPQGRAIWVVALSVFAVSALHLAEHRGSESWWTAAVGHHASLPLALAILHRDYRFALADIFLKRALTLTLLVAAVLVLHLTLGVSWLAPTLQLGPESAPLTTYVLGLALAAALLHGPLRQAAAWFVDTVVLRRSDYAQLPSAIIAEIAALDDEEAVLQGAADRLGETLDASWIDVREIELAASSSARETVTGGAAGDALLRQLNARSPRWAGEGPRALEHHAHVVVVVPTVDSPGYAWRLGPLMGGRRLLSDDLSLIESVALAVGRRIDAIRVAHERFETTMREQQISRLATEAELRALRAQLNPHFLFNALTTIGYLIKASPARAQDTLLRLTSLLRGVLRRTTDEFATLGEEIDLVRAYLDIEQARFEERLRVTIEVPDELRTARVPSLLLQPLVENAVKHGIGPVAAGGDVSVSVCLGRGEHDGADCLCVTVRDTGLGATDAAMARGRRYGLGISSVERRLQSHYGDGASLDVVSVPEEGTTVKLTIPLGAPAAARARTATHPPSLTIH